MIDFFLKNYTWIFSGIGVVILTIIYQLYVRKKENKESSLKNTHISTKSGNNVILSGSSNNTVQIISNQLKEETSPANRQEEKRTIAKIDPTYINDEIERAPLFQQVDVGKNFIGFEVKWELKLSAIRRVRDNSFFVLFKQGDSITPDIFVRIDIETYPILKISKNGSMFEIEGKIIACLRHEIELDVKSIRAID